MGKEFIVTSLEDMCDLMCNNIIPERRSYMTSQEYTDRIRKIIKLKNLSIGEIEQKCGVAKGYLSRVKANDTGISLELAQMLAEQTGYSFVDVLTRDIPKELEMWKAKRELAELEERAKGLKKLLEEEG